MRQPTHSLVLSALRHATARHHREVEATLRMAGEWDMAHYRRVLCGFHHYLSAWEPALEAALPPRLRAWFGARSRMPWLRDDLRVLAVPALSDAPPVRLPILSGPQAAMGSLYVMEGSALGGQWIARQLRERHGRAPSDGGAYFHGWGGRTGAMWRGFLTLLEQEAGEDEAGIAQACHAAADTFASLQEHFEALLHERVPS